MGRGNLSDYNPESYIDVILRHPVKLNHGNCTSFLWFETFHCFPSSFFGFSKLVRKIPYMSFRVSQSSPIHWSTTHLRHVYISSWTDRTVQQALQLSIHNVLCNNWLLCSTHCLLQNWGVLVLSINVLLKDWSVNLWAKKIFHQPLLKWIRLN